jgi:DNA-binding PadR family transcriptional regulator
MERELLLLGLLRMHDMHGYQINEFMGAHLGTSVQLKKPTAYKLLGAMADEGWIEHREEQEGNYPTRRVYRITPDGEAAFQRLLRQSLADYRPASHLGSIGFMYLDALPREEAATLLGKRREEVESIAQRIRADEEHQGGFEMMRSYHLHYLHAELGWIDEVIARLRSA